MLTNLKFGLLLSLFRLNIILSDEALATAPVLVDVLKPTSVAKAEEAPTSTGSKVFGVFRSAGNVMKKVASDSGKGVAGIAFGIAGGIDYLGGKRGSSDTRSRTSSAITTTDTLERTSEEAHENASKNNATESINVATLPKPENLGSGTLYADLNSVWASEADKPRTAKPVIAPVSEVTTLDNPESDATLLHENSIPAETLTNISADETSSQIPENSSEVIKLDETINNLISNTNEAVLNDVRADSVAIESPLLHDDQKLETIDQLKIPSRSTSLKMNVEETSPISPLTLDAVPEVAVPVMEQPGSVSNSLESSARSENHPQNCTDTFTNNPTGVSSEPPRMSSAELEVILECIFGTIEEAFNLSDPEFWIRQKGFIW